MTKTQSFMTDTDADLFGTGAFSDECGEGTDVELPLAWDTAFTDTPSDNSAERVSIPDALILSLANLGRVDIEYIAEKTGANYREIIDTLRGSIFQNPDTWHECFFKGWETAEEYLSGNLMRKWKRANEENERYHGRFADNLKAIEAVLPKSVATKEIYITLGSPWVPADIIDSFITHIFKIWRRPYVGTIHDELTGSWELPNKSYYHYHASVAATSTYGTQRIEALNILERTLNMRSVTVTDEVSCTTTASGKKRIINKTETLLAIEKQKKMIAEFKSWVWKDKERKERLETIFENSFSCVRRRIFDGGFLTLPGLSSSISLYPYQKNAVARILFSDNTLLAHDVGSGKTYVMIAAGMELCRMGLSRKNLYVVPNNIVGQWQSIFNTMYPKARVLCVAPKDFTPQKREATLKEVRDGEYDGIIMAYSCFERIPLSQEYYIERLKEEKELVKNTLKNRKKATATLERRSERISKELAELAVAENKTEGMICFDSLGITRLFVDEAHNYKNVPIETKADRVLGLSSAGSKKCRDMMDKVRYLQRNRGGVVMATGTPITNSITDAFIMQKYLQSGELELLELQSFDAWIGMFAEQSCEFEIDVDTSTYRLATRFSKFHNLPELTSLLSSVADFHQVDKTAGIPDFDGYEDALIPRTEAFSRYLDTISERAEQVRAGTVKRKDDNMLKITTDGRKAALDLRLVEPAAPFTHQSKVASCAENVYDIYMKTRDRRSSQLIFCDSSTPKAGFNIYDELKGLLTAMGIPAEDIAYIHDAESERQRDELFSKVNRGDIRILIGSTFKLGLGVNVQNKLIALHHLDIPWRPADMTQREGRILRQGNENERVQIFRYITEGSFDAYSWQLLETKERFIVGLLSGSLTQRCGSDIEGTVLNYAEIKALAIGNPLVKKRVEVANELTRLVTLQRKAVENRIILEKELSEIPDRIGTVRELIEKCRLDITRYEENLRDYDKEERKELRKRLFDALASNALAPEETVFMNYQGFDITLPANMTEDKPFVWLCGEGRYYLEMGGESGVFIRIDNFLDKLPSHLESLEESLSDLCIRKEAIERELMKKEDYTEKIERIKLRLERLDKKLGVQV